MSQLHLLYQLQQTDNEIREKKQRLGAVLKAQKVNDALNNAQVAADAAAATLHKWQTKQTDRNLEIAGLDEKKNHSEQRLYSGKVKNPKELEDLQKEVASLTRRRAQLDDELLGIIMELEEAQTVNSKAEDQLLIENAAWEETLNRLKTEQNQLAVAVNKLLAKRKTQISRIEPATLKQYLSLSKQKKGVAVAGLKNNICQGCGVSVSAHIAKLARDNQYIHCGSCGRLLNPL